MGMFSPIAFYDAIERFIITTRTSSIVNFCRCSYGSAKMIRQGVRRRSAPPLDFYHAPACFSNVVHLRFCTFEAEAFNAKVYKFVRELVGCRVASPARHIDVSAITS
jgi:hypothetical protein